MEASGARSAELIYDPLGRLWEINQGPSSKRRFLYDVDAMVEERNELGTLLGRYVHGGGIDNPLVWYDGSDVGSTNRRHLFSNWQGSITAITDDAGTALIVNAYDAYGIPNDTNHPEMRFSYTGQIWLSELGLYHYKARAYSPTLGRFLQTDPIGYEDQYNLYAYVGNDPVNMIDPTGESCVVVFNIAACYIDKVVTKDGGAPSKQLTAKIMKFNKEYTRQVNRLLSLTDKSVTIPDFYTLYGGDKAGGFTITRKEAAANLANRKFVCEENTRCPNANFCTGGGPGGALRARSTAITYVTDSGLTNSATGIVHDGALHSSSQELTGGLTLPYNHGVLGIEPGATDHQTPYREAACSYKRVAII